MSDLVTFSVFQIVYVPLCTNESSRLQNRSQYVPPQLTFSGMSSSQQIKTKYSFLISDLLKQSEDGRHRTQAGGGKGGGRLLLAIQGQQEKGKPRPCS